MRTQGFLGVLTPVRKDLEIPGEVVFIFRDRRVSGRLYLLDTEAGPRLGEVNIRVTLRRSLSLSWKDEFEALDGKRLNSLGRGIVLYPLPPKASRRREQVDSGFLRALRGSDKTMLEALCRSKGLAGLRQQEVEELTGLGPSRLHRLAQKLEEEGRVKILRFAPLFLLSGESFPFLLDQIVLYIEKYHRQHPGRRGVPLDRVQRRFGLSRLVFQVALKALEHLGRVRREGQRLVLPSHEVKLSAEEEQVLSRLEEMCYLGELRSLSLEEIRREFRLSPERLDNLLAILMERKKILQAADGLYLHAHWLEEVIRRVRELGKKEMTVGEFKALTGLSRKYAIPLLELLDQMAITRRKGATREIL